jgi:hypothetical protein
MQRKKPDYITTSFAGFDVDAIKNASSAPVALSAFFTSYCLIQKWSIGSFY